MVLAKDLGLDQGWIISRNGTTTTARRLIMSRPMPWPHQGLFVPFWPHKRESMHELGTLNVTNCTLQHMGSVLLDETEVVLKHGNRYGPLGVMAVESPPSCSRPWGPGPFRFSTLLTFSLPSMLS